MQRRQFVRGGLAAGPFLAGCLGLPGGGPSPTPRPTASIIDRDDPPAIPVEPAVEVVESAASAAGPPELRVAVANTADHPIEVGEERAIVFAFVSTEERPGLVLVPVDGEYDPVEPGCWRLAEPIAIPEYYGIVSLAPGESTERHLRVWGSPDGAGCLPTGEFRFTTRYAGARDRTEGIDEQAWSGRWGFTLALA